MEVKVGTVQGDLTVTKIGDLIPNEKRQVYTVCVCGETKQLRLADFRRAIKLNTYMKCDTCNKWGNKNELIGKKINHLTILSLEDSEQDDDIANGIVLSKELVKEKVLKNPSYRAARVMVECDCNTSEPFKWGLTDIKRGRKKYCGMGRCTVGPKNNRGGLTSKSNPAYRPYSGMIARCYDERHKSYYNYGNRNITVCDEWKDKVNGLKNYTEWYLKNKPADVNSMKFTVDRIDGTKGYSPENCRFANKHDQSANQGKNITNTSGYIGVQEINNKHFTNYAMTIGLPTEVRREYRFKTKEDAVIRRNYYILLNNTEHHLQHINRPVVMGKRKDGLKGVVWRTDDDVIKETTNGYEEVICRKIVDAMNKLYKDENK